MIVPRSVRNRFLLRAEPTGKIAYAAEKVSWRAIKHSLDNISEPPSWAVELRINKLFGMPKA